MPTKSNTIDPKDVSLTSLALALEPDALVRWLEANPVDTIIKGKKGKPDTTRTAPRVLTLSTVAPADLFCATVRYSAGMAGGEQGSGGFAGGSVEYDKVLPDVGNILDVKSGNVGRAIRRSLFAMYLPSVDADNWEAERDERISGERSRRMSDLAAQRGVSVETINKKVSMLDTLRGNSKVMALLMETEPDIAALLAEFDTES